MFEPKNNNQESQKSTQYQMGKYNIFRIKCAEMNEIEWRGLTSKGQGWILGFGLPGLATIEVYSLFQSYRKNIFLERINSDLTEIMFAQILKFSKIHGCLKYWRHCCFNSWT